MKVLVLQAGGLGDMVLLAPSLAAIRSRWAEAELTLVCRREFASIIGLYSCDVDRVVGIDFDPYSFVPASAVEFDIIRGLLASLTVHGWDLLVSAELAPTWITTVLGAALAPARFVRGPGGASSAAVIDGLLEQLDLQPVAFDTYEAPPGIAERKRYAALLEVVGAPAIPAALQLSHELRERADAWFGGLQLGKSTIACFPCGNRGVRIKQWPIERFVETLARVAVERDLTVLVVGDVGDSVEAERFLGLLRARGVAAAIYLDRSEDVALTGAIIERARAYLGNDTGLAHLGSALNVPGVTVYGGGTWPSFAPWAPGSTGVVQPLPCFGCGWDCAFGQPLCIDMISVDDVARALEGSLTRPRAPHQVVALEHCTEREASIIESASTTYRRAQADRHRRYDVIVQLRRARAKAEERIAGLQALEDSAESRSDEVKAIAMLRLEMLMESERDLRRLTAQLDSTRAAEDS